MNIIYVHKAKSFQEYFTPTECQKAIQNLEQGKVLYFPHLPFQLLEEDYELLSSRCLNSHAKNISFNPKDEITKGVINERVIIVKVKAMMQRFSTFAFTLLTNLIPHYQSSLILGRTSYRPAEIYGRQTSYRQDDTRLHVDAFPSAPNQGKRIIRVFSNINPHGQSRIWKLGEPFEEVAKRFLPRIKKPLPGIHSLLHLLKITKSQRTLYDHYMLKLHDLMKSDLEYQREVSKIEFAFVPQSSWMVMTDHVSHAAIAGQYVLEQTFYLPVSGMLDENLSPLRVLERLTSYKLV